MNISVDLEALREEKEIILFGVGKSNVSLLLQNGIVPICFCDNNKSLVGQQKDGLEIYSYDQVKKIYKNPVFIVVSSFEVIAQLSKDGYDVCYLAPYLYHVLEHKSTFHEELFIEKTKNLKHERHCSDILYAKNIDIPITDKCTLRCKDCCNLMPFYKKPVDYDLSEIYSDIDNITEVFDQITELRILGGEPFVHPNVYDIVDYATKKSNISCVTLFTNSTLPLDGAKLVALNQKKVMLEISDYGDLSRNLQQNIEILENNSIPYMVKKLDRWIDCIGFDRQEYTEAELVALFQTCCTKNTNTFLDGKLYLCSYAASLDRLSAAPKEAFDYVDLRRPSATGKAFKNIIKQYLYGRKYIKTCCYCVGRDSVNGKMVPPAIQTRDKLSYKQYESIKE